MKANQPCSLGQLKPTGAAVFNLGTPGYQGLGRGAPGMGMARRMAGLSNDKFVNVFWIPSELD